MINPAIENDLKNMSLNDVNYADYIKENYVPIEVLQEIRDELTKHYVDPYNRNAFRYTTVSLLDVLDLIDKHIKEGRNDTTNKRRTKSIP